MYSTLIKTISCSATGSCRYLHSTPVIAKSVKETVSEVADKVNKGLGKGLASAIDKGENATKATQESLGAAKWKGSEAKQKMNEKSDQVASGARKVKEDMKGETNK